MARNSSKSSPGKDKHPPRDWSTNKTVKSPAKGTSVGAPFKTAAGSKRVKPSVPSSTSAKVATPPVSNRQKALDAQRSAVKSAADQNEAKANKHKAIIDSQRKTGVISDPKALRRFTKIPKSHRT